MFLVLSIWSYGQHHISWHTSSIVSHFAFPLLCLNLVCIYCIIGHVEDGPPQLYLEGAPDDSDLPTDPADSAQTVGKPRCINLNLAYFYLIIRLCDSMVVH